MTRPFAGQRNFGTAPVPSASFAASLSNGSVGATTLAFCTDSTSFGAADATGFAGAATAGALAFTAGACAPGMVRGGPKLSVAVGWMLLSLSISFIYLW